MKITGIQNYISINQPHLESKKAAPKTQRPDYNYQYNPIYYMPTFKSQTTDNFTRLFNKGLEEDLSQDELDKLSHYIRNVKAEIMRDEDSFIGEGASSSVYRINDEYVLRVKHKYHGERNGQFRYNKDNKFNDLPCYYGGGLATCDNLSVLRNADPRGDAIVAGRPYWSDGEEANDYMLNTSLPAFANLPQSAYDNYAYTLKSLNDKSGKSGGLPERFMPDIFNPNNYMAVDNEIRIVDGIMVSCDDEWNDMGNMCIPLFEDILSYNPKKNAENIRNEKEIFKKCILAAEEAELPTPYDPCSVADLKKIMNDLYRDTRAKDFVDFIKTTREQESDKEKRKQVISDYIDNMK